MEMSSISHRTARRRWGTGALLALLCLAPVIGPVRGQAATVDSVKSLDPRAGETKAEHDKRMKWWREARFGMFIHWGLYSVPAGVWKGRDTHGEFSAGAGEWIMHDLKIPVDDYAAFADQFDPEKFNANEWVSIAKAAGMKYIVMTAKHHEGFAMYPSKVDRFNIHDATVFRRDPIGEMAAACKKAGIKFGVYYSQNLDWHHPGGGTAGPPWDPKQIGDFDTYIKTISAPQVDELLTRYHPAVIWWDIPSSLTPDEIKALTAAFPEDPDIISNNRMGGNIPGDTETPEQHIPATGLPGRDWETCMTINDTWGYKVHDTNFKSTETLLHNLIDIASKGGNYLLNVGPTSEGIIPEPEVERLEEMGAWMKANGASIYGTSASPYRRLPFDGRVTVKGDTLYVNVFHWPAAGLVVPRLMNRVRSAGVLATGQRLAVRQATDGSVSIDRPSTVDPISTAIALRFDGAPVVGPELPMKPSADGSFRLTAADATLDGDSMRIEGDETPNIGYWTNSRDTAYWKIDASAAGVYKVKLVYACAPGADGSTFAVKVDGASAAMGSIVSTAGWQDYTMLSLVGTVSLTPGTHEIRIIPLTMPHGAVMNLRSITLTPSG